SKVLLQWFVHHESFAYEAGMLLFVLWGHVAGHLYIKSTFHKSLHDSRDRNKLDPLLCELFHHLQRQAFQEKTYRQKYLSPHRYETYHEYSHFFDAKL